ncbi:MAG: hypothetical protein ACRETX_16695 [Steroidobacteraceae bacterium]
MNRHLLDQFDGDALFELAVGALREKNGAHSTMTEHADDAVRAQLSADQPIALALDDVDDGTADRLTQPLFAAGVRGQHRLDLAAKLDIVAANEFEHRPALADRAVYEAIKCLLQAGPAFRRHE